ncbi:exgA [Symbiodinium natans]|uniref:ExgA protein n=1 Tax=Symbiodinium natans TaxID=878477 RepID=A0A812RIN0_9DINO|nr:exgA [Symbiodinium natans]
MAARLALESDGRSISDPSVATPWHRNLLESARTWPWGRWALQGLASALIALVVVAIYDAARGGNKNSAISPDRLPRPLTGVNLGGWLCLEDWFFSGPSGRDVMSMTPAGQGACLPPLVSHLTTTWPSEGLLTQRLVESKGPEFASSALQSHRREFISNSDLDDIAGLGMRRVRLPLTWAAFADALTPIDAAVYGGHNADHDTAIVPDPFYNHLAAFATVPRAWLADFFRRAGERKLGIVLDLHAFPGGSSNGTYNGIWPSPPAFWQQQSAIGNRSVLLTDAGILIVERMISWLESLDSTALDAVTGVSLMNEPAHMAAIDRKSGTPWVTESQVLSWLTETADRFRKSKLPGLGKKLYVQLIETAFDDFDGTVVPWFKRTFTKDERRRWVVADLHNYVAWSYGSCDGRLLEGGGWLCDASEEEQRKRLRSCVSPWAKSFQQRFGDGLMAVSEFSVGTYSMARLACDDPAVTRLFLDEQLLAFAGQGIEPFFWTWRMPYGPVFEGGWSLKHFANLEPRPSHPCGISMAQVMQV